MLDKHIFIPTTSNPPTLKELKKIAKTFSPFARIVPCQGIEGKKVAILKNWVQSDLTADDFEDFPSADMVGVVLEDLMLVIDVDGISAIKLLSELNILNQGDLETLILSSNPSERFALFFFLPEGATVPFLKISTDKEKGEQLEFRVGSHYQIVGGLHPKTLQPYLQSGTVRDIKDAPEALLNFVKNYNSSKKSTEPSSERKNSPLVKESSEDLGEVFVRPLHTFLPKESASFYKEPFEGNRDDGCFRVACDLLGLEQRLTELDIPFEGSAEHAYFAMWERVPGNGIIPANEPFTEREFEKCWRSASSKERDIVTDDEYLYQLAGIELEDDFEEEETDSSVALKTAKKVSQSNQIPADYAEIDKKIIEALEGQTVLPAQEWIICNKICDGDTSLFDYCRLRIRELNIQEESGVNPKDVKKIIEKKAQFSKEDLLAGLDFPIIRDMIKNSEVFNVPLHYYFTSFLTASSAMVPKHYKFNWNLSGKLPPSLFTLIVGRASYGKDVIIGDYIKPLVDESKDINNREKAYNDALKEAVEEYKAMGKKDRDDYTQQFCETSQIHFDPSMTPKQKRELFLKSYGLEVYEAEAVCAVNNGSLPKITQLAGEQDDYGFIICPAEIMEFIANTESIQKNKAGLTPLITMWDGGSTLANFKSQDLVQKAGNYQVSLLSGIQTDRYRQLFDKADPAGIQSRCLYMFLESPIDLPDATEDDIIELGANPNFIQDLDAFYKLYKSILTSALPSKTDDKGVTSYEQLLLKWEKREKGDKRPIEAHRAAFYNFSKDCKTKANLVKERNQAAEQWLRRLPNQCARIILNIQALRFYAGQAKSLTDICPESVTLALKLMAVYQFDYERLNQVQLEETESFDEDNNLVIEFFEAVKKISAKKQKASLKTTDFSGNYILEKRSFLDKYADKNCKRLRKEHLFKIFRDLVAADLCEFNEVTGAIKVKN